MSGFKYNGVNYTITKYDGLTYCRYRKDGIYIDVCPATMESHLSNKIDVWTTEIANSGGADTISSSTVSRFEFAPALTKREGYSYTMRAQLISTEYDGGGGSTSVTLIEGEDWHDVLVNNKLIQAKWYFLEDNNIYVEIWNDTGGPVLGGIKIVSLGTGTYITGTRNA